MKGIGGKKREKIMHTLRGRCIVRIKNCILMKEGLCFGQKYCRMVLSAIYGRRHSLFVLHQAFCNRLFRLGLLTPESCLCYVSWLPKEYGEYGSAYEDYNGAAYGG